MNKIILSVIILLLCVVVVNASDDYTKVGYSELGDYYTGEYGDWNPTQNSTKSWEIAIDNRYYRTVPKVGFMDDGVKYVIAYSSPSIALFKWDGTRLNIVDSYQIEDATNFLDGDFILSKINGKNYIIYSLKASSSSVLVVHMLRFNTTFTDITIPISAPSTNTKYCTFKYSNGVYNEIYTGCPTVISCNQATNECMVMYQNAINKFSFATFDNTGYNKKFTYTTLNYGGADGLSLPSNPSLIYSELNDGDIEKDVVFSYYVGGFDGSNNYIYRPSVLSLNVEAGTHTITLDWNQEIRNEVSSSPTNSIGGWCRDIGLSEKYSCSRKISGLMSLDFDGSVSNGKELFIAVFTTKNNYKVYEISPIDGSYRDKHPDSFDLEGQFISNPIRLDCFTQTGAVDMGIMSYDTTNKQIVFECSASTNYVGINNDCEYTHFNVNYTDFDSYAYGKFIHPIETDGTKGDELITQFGIFDLDDPQYLAFVCGADINKIYSWNEPSLSVYPIDYENTNKADLLMSSVTMLRYLDDGDSNQNAQISRIIYNPCTTENGAMTEWRVNNSVRITVRANDSELNNFRARVVLYYNSNLIQDSGWSAYYPSSTDIDIAMIPLSMVGVSTIRVYVQDTEHTETDYEDTYFSVGNSLNSKVFGDCVTISSVVIIPPSDDNNTLFNNTVNINNNVITNTLKDITKPTGLSLTILYIIIMIVIAIVILFSPIEQSNKFPLILIVEVLAIIIGVKLTLFGVGTLIIMAIVGIISMMGYMRRLTTGE